MAQASALLHQNSLHSWECHQPLSQFIASILCTRLCRYMHITRSICDHIAMGLLYICSPLLLCGLMSPQYVSQSCPIHVCTSWEIVDGIYAAGLVLLFPHTQSPEIRKYKRKFNGEILCGALWGVNLLVGTDNGLLLLDRSGHGKGGLYLEKFLVCQFRTKIRLFRALPIYYKYCFFHI